jgi:hypothetical protein
MHWMPSGWGVWLGILEAIAANASVAASERITAVWRSRNKAILALRDSGGASAQPRQIGTPLSYSMVSSASQNAHRSISKYRRFNPNSEVNHCQYPNGSKQSAQCLPDRVEDRTRDRESSHQDSGRQRLEPGVNDVRTGFVGFAARNGRDTGRIFLRVRVGLGKFRFWFLWWIREREWRDWIWIGRFLWSAHTLFFALRAFNRYRLPGEEPASRP